MPTASQQQPLHIVYALVVVYALCYQLQSPIEPFLVAQLSEANADAAAEYASLRTFFNCVQTVGSFLVGYLADVIGLRALFALNFVACAASYGLLWQASSMAGLYASKVPTLFMAGFLCAQTAAAKLTPAGPARAGALGRLTTAYTLGGVVGPAVGGRIGNEVAAPLAVAGSLLAALLVLLLPAAVDKEEAEEAGDGAGSDQGKKDAPPAPSGSWFSRMGQILPAVWPLLLTKLASGVANSAVGAARPIVLKELFSFDQAGLGAVMSAAFFGNALVGLALGHLSSALGGARRTVGCCLAAMVAGYAALAAAYAPDASAPQLGALPFLGLSLALSLAQFPLATTLTALSTAAVPPRLKGTLVGAEHAAFALAGMVSPAAGVGLFRAAGLRGVASGAALVYASLVAFWLGSARAAAAAAEKRKDE